MRGTGGPSLDLCRLSPLFSPHTPGVCARHCPPILPPMLPPPAGPATLGAGGEGEEFPQAGFCWVQPFPEEGK